MVADGQAHVTAAPGRERGAVSPARTHRLRIVVHDCSGHPFQVELSRALARRGHVVRHVHCPSFVTGKGRLELEAGDPPTLAIEAVDLDEPFAKYSITRRLRHEVRYGARLASRILAHGADVVLSANTPLLAGATVLTRCRAARIPFVWWQQDVYSFGIRDELTRRVPGVGRRAGAAFVALERRLLRASHAVVTITDDFLPVLERWGIAADRCHVIENWAPLDEVTPRPRRNAWSHSQGLDDRTVLLYSGTLGRKHDPSLLLDAIDALRDVPGAVLVVVSEGPGAEWLRDAAHGRDDIVVLPYQPYERLGEVLASADVLLTVLEHDAGVFSVPSKVLTYLCAGRAVAAAVPGGNLAARIVTRAGAGVVADPSDRAAWRVAVRELATDAAWRAAAGRSARAYAERTFAIEPIADRFEAVLRAACAARTGVHPQVPVPAARPTTTGGR